MTLQQIRMDLLDPTLSAEDFRAKTSRLLEIVRDWMESEAYSGTNIYGWSESFGLLGSLSRTSLASYLRTMVKTSKSSSKVFPNAGMVWRGAYWMAKIGESHSGAVACSLLDILKPHAPSKYCLSPKACAGIPEASVETRKEVAGTLGGGSGGRGWTDDLDRSGAFLPGVALGNIVYGPTNRSDGRDWHELARARALNHGGGPGASSGIVVSPAPDAGGVREAPGVSGRLDPAAPDGPRYAALGDAVTVPVIEWIGRRILAASKN